MATLEEIVSRLFNIQTSQVNDELSRRNSEQWDSFNHLLLITEIEATMAVKFTTSEVEEIKTFKQLKEIVANKIG